jgi:alpha-galactosidase
MIEINQKKLVFQLHTDASSYIIKVADSGHLLNLYYGRRIVHRDDLAILDHQYQVDLGSTTAYSPGSGNFCLETQKLEVATTGKGDYRDPSLHIVYCDDGSSTSDFLYDRHIVHDYKPPLAGLPQTHCGAEKQRSLTIILKEKIKPVELHLHYSCFEHSNVITRSLEIINLGESAIKLDRAYSLSLDLFGGDFDAIHLSGKWINEGQVERHALAKGQFSIGSKRGVSSATHNPFMALVDPTCTDQAGECFGFAMIYSGNHHISAEVSPYEQTRIMLGISDFDFEWPLGQNERFICPEVAMTYSHEGLNQMSAHFHHLINHHLIPTYWQGRSRPVQVNNWEATYFDFDEDKLVKIASKAHKMGVELFVLDDGWFGKRDNDKSSLGDFFPHTKKLPGGLAQIAKKIRKQGLDFGLWVEPEMISPDSELYRNHPEWAVTSPGRDPSLGRQQLLLDMSNPAVIDYLYQQLADVFKQANVSYVKWDHNRNFSDVYSHWRNSEQQSGFYHRYTLGLYELLFRLQAAFPKVLFENCSSGGNRFDLGMTYFMPQTWTSDNTDAHARVAIQQGFSLLYPQSCMSAHVSGRPSHQVLRHTPIETRFNVASFGNLGYQTDLTKLTHFEQKAAKKQIEFYKQHRQLLQFGQFYRLETKSHCSAWIVVSADKTEAIIGYFQSLQQSNPSLERLKLPMLESQFCYQITSRKQYQNIRQYGDLVNEQLPIAIKDRGMIHGLIANRVMHPVTAESYTAYGDQLSHFGLPLKSQFTGTEMTDHVRHIGDFGSRLYYLTAIVE